MNPTQGYAQSGKGKLDTLGKEFIIMLISKARPEDEVAVLKTITPCYSKVKCPLCLRDYTNSSVSYYQAFRILLPRVVFSSSASPPS